MVRDRLQTNLNELVVRYQDLVQRYQQAVALAVTTEYRSRFQALADEREADARVLAQRIRQSGDLPDAPDSDRELVQRLFTQAKSALSADREGELAAEAQQAENRLLELLMETLALPSLPPDLQSLLDMLRQQSGRAMEILTRASG